MSGVEVVHPTYRSRTIRLRLHVPSMSTFLWAAELCIERILLECFLLNANILTLRVWIITKKPRNTAIVSKQKRIWDYGFISLEAKRLEMKWQLHPPWSALNPVLDPDTVFLLTLARWPMASEHCWRTSDSLSYWPGLASGISTVAENFKKIMMWLRIWMRKMLMSIFILSYYRKE